MIQICAKSSGDMFGATESDFSTCSTGGWGVRYGFFHFCLASYSFIGNPCARRRTDLLLAARGKCIAHFQTCSNLLKLAQI